MAATARAIWLCACHIVLCDQINYFRLPHTVNIKFTPVGLNPLPPYSSLSEVPPGCFQITSAFFLHRKRSVIEILNSFLQKPAIVTGVCQVTWLFSIFCFSVLKTKNMKGNTPIISYIPLNLYVNTSSYKTYILRPRCV